MRNSGLRGLVVVVALLSPASALLAASSGKVFARLKVCPGQECTFGEWRARGEVTVYADRSTASPVAFRATRGEAVTGVEAQLIVVKPGACTAVKPIQAYESATKVPVSIPAKQRLSVLYFANDNYAVANFGKKRIEACCVGDDIECKSDPQTELWLKVKSKNGVVGWTNERDKFSGTAD